MGKLSDFSRGLAIGSAVGLVGGIAGSYWYQKNQNLSPDEILNQIKKAFLEEGPIEGSWISFETKPLRKFAVRMNGVEGGITRLEDGKLVAYEFLADVKTGAVLTIDRLAL
ncbi:hypothetical protein JZO70_17105 [Enterococcus sp. 669A]|uniref:PepSY domain-containing protein n=1 Tax=Candidatus Enterococcus moelleringii TaxID=2815325 RepID=A0ABS3LE36_9ENTE|nr:hypothetical protein [Enterococcus sp. 669A]MBO1307896.1 hypothetical protein [Enterococcus sp. 669A]